MVCQAREMDKRREGRPGDARAALRRSVRENGFVFVSESCHLFIPDFKANVIFIFKYSYFHFVDVGLT